MGARSVTGLVTLGQDVLICDIDRDPKIQVGVVLLNKTEVLVGAQKTPVVEESLCCGC